MFRLELLAFTVFVTCCLQSRYVLVSAAGGSVYTYFGESNGRDQWNTLFPDSCGGRRQSPVNLLTEATEYRAMDNFVFSGFNKDASHGVRWTLLNNGHTAQVTYTAGDVRVSGGSLGGDYMVAQFHFHWGSVDTQGSEHVVGSMEYPLELHVVTWNMKYANFTDAIGHHDGLAVLGFFFEVYDLDNPQLEPIIESLEQVLVASSVYVMPNNSVIALDNMLPGYSRFYRYLGSLTTPFCNEIVTWTVFDPKIRIGKNQMAIFRLLKDDDNHALVDNYRLPQPLFGRKVYASWEDFDTAAASGLKSVSSLLLASLIVALGLRL